jgi:hypothetical protein
MSNIILPREPFIPGTVKPESDYEEFSRLGAKLGLPCPQAHITLESFDASGDLVDRYHDRSRTLNRNYWNWLFKAFGGFIASPTSPSLSLAMASNTTFGAGHLTNKTTAAAVTNTNVTNFNPPPSVIAGIGVATAGIVVGTGTAAEAFDDAALGAAVANGTGAGQMSYQAMALAAPSYNAGTLTWTWVTTRIMNNNSGGTIVVGETGIYGYQSITGASYMIMRDKLGATVSVLSGGQVTCTYTMSLTFPA